MLSLADALTDCIIQVRVCCAAWYVLVRVFVRVCMYVRVCLCCVVRV